jgi:hypothetical protein
MKRLSSGYSKPNIFVRLERDTPTSFRPVGTSDYINQEHYQEDFLILNVHFVQHENPEICNLVMGRWSIVYWKCYLETKRLYVETNMNIYLLVPSSGW